MGVLSVRGLTKHYGDTVAVEDLSFEVERGEVFGFLGPNGAGKTTTIRAVLGFHAPTEGTAELFGRDVRDESALLEAKRNVGYLPSSPAFDGDVTGRRYLDFHADLKGDSRRAELLDLFTPPLDRKIREYSTGNKQMLGLVQTFMHDPDLVVMDEPTSGLDPLKQEQFNQFVRDERARGTTLFLSSHVLAEVRRICDRVGIIRRGHLVALEDVESLLERGGKRVRVQTDPPLDPGDLGVAGVVDFERLGPEARFTFTGDYDALLDALAARTVLDLEIEEPPLEDVFMHYYGAAPDAREDDTEADESRDDTETRNDAETHDDAEGRDGAETRNDAETRDDPGADAGTRGDADGA